MKAAGIDNMLQDLGKEVKERAMLVAQGQAE